MIDSGSAFHITGDLSLLHNVVPTHQEFGMISGKLQCFSHKGVVTFTFPAVDSRKKAWNIDLEVYYLEGAKRNIISAYRFDESCEASQNLTTGHYYIKKDKNKYILADKLVITQHGRYFYHLASRQTPTSTTDLCSTKKTRAQETLPVTTLRFNSAHELCCHIAAPTATTYLHAMFGHMSSDSLRYLASRYFKRKTTNFKLVDCVACMGAKITRNSYPGRQSSTVTSCLTRLHVDLAGPISYSGGQSNSAVMDHPTVTLDSYFMLVKDEYSRYKWYIPLIGKDAAVPQLITLLEYLSKRYPQYDVAEIHSDQGTEFTNATLDSYFERKGIKSHYAPAGEAQINGLIEREMQTVKYIGYSILRDSGMHHCFWPYAFKHAAYLSNFTPRDRRKSFMPQIGDDTKFIPYEILHYEPSMDISEFRHHVAAHFQNLYVFGCSGVYLDPHALGQRDKTQEFPRGEPAIYLGVVSDASPTIIHVFLPLRGTIRIASVATFQGVTSDPFDLANLFTQTIWMARDQGLYPVPRHLKDICKLWRKPYQAYCRKESNISASRPKDDIIFPTFDKMQYPEPDSSDSDPVSLPTFPVDMEDYGDSFYEKYEPPIIEELPESQDSRDGSQPSRERDPDVTSEVPAESPLFTPTRQEETPRTETGVASTKSTKRARSESVTDQAPSDKSLPIASRATDSVLRDIQPDSSRSKRSKPSSSKRKRSSTEARLAPLDENRDADLAIDPGPIKDSKGRTREARTGAVQFLTRIAKTSQPKRRRIVKATSTLDRHKTSTNTETDPVSSPVIGPRQFSAPVEDIILSILDPSDYRKDLPVINCEPSFNERIPETFQQAIQSPSADRWRSAMDLELETIEQLHVWERVHLPKGVEPVKSRWVFAHKPATNGEVARYKARLVAVGTSQRPGRDFDETYSEVVDISVVRLMLALALHRGYHMKQLDVSNAFLNAELKEDIYMRPPPGFSDPQKRVYKLKKALYGLKQAPLAWLSEIQHAVKELGFQSVASTHGLFTRVCDGVRTILVLYVDDILIISPKVSEIDDVIGQLQKRYTLRVFGRPETYLSYYIENLPDGSMLLDCNKSTTSILQSFSDLINPRLNQVVPILDTEAHISVQIELGTDPESSMTLDELKALTKIPNFVPLDAERKQRYQSAVGSFNYLASRTRLDLSYATSQLSRHCHNPREIHWKMLKRLVTFLSKHPSGKLLYPRTRNAMLEGYSDATYGGDQVRYPHGGFIWRFGNCPIHWESRREKHACQSVHEVELRTLVEAIIYGEWFQNILFQLGEITKEDEVILRSDSQSSVQIMNNIKTSGKTMRLHIHVDKIKEAMAHYNFKVVHVKGIDNHADAFTKALSESVAIPAFERLIVYSDQLKQQGSG